jgi:hypothetical protein
MASVRVGSTTHWRRVPTFGHGARRRSVHSVAFSHKKMERSTGDAAAAAAVAAAVVVAAASSAPAISLVASQPAPSKSPRAARTRALLRPTELGRSACAFRTLGPRPPPPRARWLLAFDGTPIFDYIANLRPAAREGAGYAAKAARVSGIMNARGMLSTLLRLSRSASRHSAQCSHRPTCTRSIRGWGHSNARGERDGGHP